MAYQHHLKLIYSLFTFKIKMETQGGCILLLLLKAMVYSHSHLASLISQVLRTICWWAACVITERQLFWDEILFYSVQVEDSLERLRYALERRRSDRNKLQEPIIVRMNEFKNLGSIIQRNGWCTSSWKRDLRVEWVIHNCKGWFVTEE